MLKNKDSIIVTDSRLINRTLPTPIIRGAKKMLYKQWDSMTNGSGDISFSCPLPVPNAEIDRNIQILCPCRVTVSAVWSIAQDGQYLAEPNQIGIRSYPIQKALERIDMRLNNHGFSINIGDIISGLEHFNTSRKLKLLEYSAA